jgi:GDP-4-dehydro-6-deoxy-D-mannose reductase
MKVLVTGAGGFVGRWLTRELTAAGHEVVGPPERELDVTDPGAMSHAIGAIRPDAIAHLAAVAYAPDAAGDPTLAFRVTVGGTVALGEALRANRVAPAVLVSGSSEVYGAPHPDSLPLAESAPLSPRTAYAISKVSQEAIALRYAAQLELPLVATRSFNHTGPGQRPVFVVPALASRVADAARGVGRPASVRVGNLDVRRDFTDVRDVVRAYRLLLERLADGSIERGGTVVNVASGRSYSIRSILERFVALSGAVIEPAVDPTLVRIDDPPDIRGDASTLAGLTGWRPERDFDSTLGDVWSEVTAATVAAR